MKAEEFDDLYGAFAEGACPPEDVERLMEAIDSDPELLPRFLAERDLEHFLGRLLRPEATDTAFLRGVLREPRAHPLTPQEFEERVFKKVGVAGAAPVKRTLVPRRRFGRPGGSGGTWALLAAGILLGFVTLVVVLSSGGRPAPRRESQAPVADAERLHRAREEMAEAERERQRMMDRLDKIEREREKLVQAQPRPEEKPDPLKEEDRRARLARAQEEKQRVEAEMRDAVERARKAREALAQAGTPAPEPKEKGPAADATVAGMAVVVERADGTVSVQGTSGKRPARAGESLRTGEGLETSGAGRAVVKFADATRMEVGPDTAIAEVSADRGKRMVLSKGTLTATVTRQARGESMVFRTPHGEATVLGTTLRLSVEERQTRLDVIEGKVRLTRTDGKAVEVSGGHFAVAAVGVELRAAALPVAVFTEDFEKSLLTGWQLPVSHPNLWGIVPDPAGKGRVLGGGTAPVFRSNVDRYAVSLRCGQDSWTDYAVEASVRFESPPPDKLRGVMLLARVRDPQNLYWMEYHNIGPSQALMIFKYSAGKSVNLTSTSNVPMPEPGRWYRLRFELQGPRLTGYLDGKLTVEVEDRDFASGRAGLARADADNVDSVIHWDDVRVERLAPPRK